MVFHVLLDSFIKHKKGLIFTFTWAYNLDSDWKYMEHVRDKFKDYKIHYVELVSDLEERVKRNETEKRLKEKPSKRNIEWSRKELIRSMDKYRLVSEPGEIKYDNYIRVDNTKLTAQKTAQLIKDTFDL